MAEQYYCVSMQFVKDKMNISAYFKYLMITRKIKLKDLSEKTSLDQGYLSRVLNNKINIQKDRNIEKLCLAFNLDKEKLFSFNREFDELFQKYLTEIYYVNKEQRNDYYQQLSSMQKKVEFSSQYIDLLLVKFIQSTFIKPYNLQLMKTLYKIHSSLSDDKNVLFLTFYYGYLLNTGQNVLALKLRKEVSSLSAENVNIHLEMMLHYFKYSADIFNVASSEYLISYERCKQICIDTNNHNRLIYLNILYAINLKTLGYISDGLKKELEILQYMNERNLTYCKRVLTNNIGNSYLLLNEYQKAIPYFIESEIYGSDNATCFFLALCYYKLDDKKNAKKYIQIGNTAKNRENYYYEMLKWLDAMIQKKYSKKAYEILIKLYNDNQENYINQQQSFIKIELINYYSYHGMHEQAYQLCAELVNKHVISQTKIDQKILSTNKT